MGLDAEWVGLIGVAVGTIGGLAGSWLMTVANASQARETRREDREQRAREMAAEAYVAAIEAVQWMSATHVEDSVDPQFEAEFRPKTERAVDHLRRAREAVTRVSALGGSAELVAVARETAVSLNVLDDAWHSAQKCRIKIVSMQGKTGPFADHYKRRFDEEFARLLAVRKALCGFGDTMLPQEEIDQGGVLPGSLLFRLRDATTIEASNKPRRRKRSRRELT